MSEVTAKLAEFVPATQYKDLPAPVVQRVKEVLLDSIGCALGGYVTDRAKIAIAMSESFGMQPEATILGYRKASCSAASFVNAELINCLDFDVLGPIGGHVAPYVLPPVLALSEKTNRSGQELILGLALALEIGGRMTASLSHLKIAKSEPPYYEEAPRFSYTSCIFGGVAGACKVLGLGADKVRNAFGIGGSSTPIPAGIKWEHIEPPAVNLKYGCWAGWVAMLGAVAALAAQKGFTGDPSVLDGKSGFWQMYGSPFFKEEAVLGNLGKVWITERMNFKSFPACYIDHTSMAGIRQLVNENHIKPEEIDEIVSYGDPLMQTPNRLHKEIRTNEDAQFAHSYLFAMAACHPEAAGPQWVMPSSFNDPVIKNLMSKVKVKTHPRAAEIMAEKLKAGAYANFRNVIVEIAARGKKFSTEVAVAKGEPADPMTPAEHADKFLLNASYSPLKPGRAEQVMEAVSKLDRLASTAELTRLLVAA